MPTPGLLLIWNDTTPVFEELAPVAGEWQLGRKHPAWAPRDGRMSREHCRIHHSDDTWHIRDLDSVNGTRLDGQPITEPVHLTDWKLLQIGHSLLIPVSRSSADTALERPAICNANAFPDLDFAALREHACDPQGTDWRPEIAWWVHHAYTRLGPFELDLPLVAAYLLTPWTSRQRLLAHAQDTVAELPRGATRIYREHFRSALDFTPPPLPDHLARLRDPDMMTRVLHESSGDPVRAAASLDISVESLHRWIRHHGIFDS